MSATIFYRKLKEPPVLPVNGKSQFLQKMLDVFGDPPWIISKENLVEFATLNKVIGENDVTNIIMKTMGEDESAEIEINFVY